MSSYRPVSDIPVLFRKYGVAKDVLEKMSLLRGDITKIGVDCIVNPANYGLHGGDGVDGSIHRAADYHLLQRECRLIGHCDIGSAVITTACKIYHVKNIIHTVGPQIACGTYPTVEDRALLISCYASALQLAVQNNLRTIAFCCVSTGVQGYPSREASQVVGHFLTSWLSTSPDRDKIDRIVICASLEMDERSYEDFFGEFALKQKEAERAETRAAADVALQLARESLNLPHPSAYDDQPTVSSHTE